MKPIRIEPEATEELAAAVDWYELRRKGLGRELLTAVDAVLEAAARDPERFPLYPGAEPSLAVRRVATRRFPFSVAFIDLDAVVRVVAIAHERRRPGYWRARLR
ncbi:MAG TPA: type II toxin-antitoxin system RelE/ParE family toxin [Polyangia bacterium]|jgi:plasmid stabilization system protein ParE|nr:type II toxin-antitoxin system RelE/ParE family toxin [Polyangia bacterium]